MKLYLAIIFFAFVSEAVCHYVDDREATTTEIISPRKADDSDEPIVIQPLDSKRVHHNDEINVFERQFGSVATCNGASVSAVGTSAANSILVRSPNYPNLYPNNLRCKYTITVPANSQLMISISNMNVECPYDYVQIAFNKAPPAATLCPLSSVSSLYTVLPQSANYTFVVLFYSDETIRYSGFSMNLYLNATTQPPATTTTTTTRSTTITTTTAATTTVAPGTCTCGRWGVQRDAEGRIVGGSIAAPNSLPYQAGVWGINSGNPFCGGTLISRTHVLTAAHCTVGFSASQLRVALSDVKYTVRGDGEVFINVKAIKNHPNYNSNSQDNDFALLELASPAPISSTIGIACLPPDVTQTFAGTAMTISGWGTTSSGGSQSSDLKVGTVQGLTNTACNSVYGSITANMICAGTSNFDTDSCQGDSGGPMVASVNGRATLVGVTSFGIGCAQSPYPGVYARVSAQKSWILANSDAGLCQN